MSDPAPIPSIGGKLAGSHGDCVSCGGREAAALLEAAASRVFSGFGLAVRLCDRAAFAAIPPREKAFVSAHRFLNRGPCRDNAFGSARSRVRFLKTRST